MAKETFQRTKPHVNVGTIGNGEEFSLSYVGATGKPTLAAKRLFVGNLSWYQQVEGTGRNRQRGLRGVGGKAGAGTVVIDGVIDDIFSIAKEDLEGGEGRGGTGSSRELLFDTPPKMDITAELTDVPQKNVAATFCLQGCLPSNWEITTNDTGDAVEVLHFECDNIVNREECIVARL